MQHIYANLGAMTYLMNMLCDLLRIEHPLSTEVSSRVCQVVAEVSIDAIDLLARCCVFVSLSRRYEEVLD
jgi:hypothetical protein